MTFIINISINFKLLYYIIKVALFISINKKSKLIVYYSNYFINYFKRFSISIITIFFAYYLISSFKDLFNLRTNIKFIKFYILISNF
jgi:hypothetical protein